MERKPIANTQLLQQLQGDQFFGPRIQRAIQFQQQQAQGPQDRGLLGNILWDLSSPLRTITGAGEMLGSTGKLNDTYENQYYQPQTLSQDELQQIQNNPLLFGAKQMAKVGSFAVPGSIGLGGIPGMAASGALSGGLYGFGGSGQGKELEGILGGAASGGALAGGLGLLGKGLGKLFGGKQNALEATGEALQRRPFTGVDTGTIKGSELLKTPQAMQEAQNMVIDELGNRLGVKVNTVDDIANNLKPLIGQYGDEINTIGQNVIIPNAKQSILDTLSGYNPEEVRQLFSSPSSAKLLREIQALPDDLTGVQLNELKQSIDKTIGGWKKVTSDTGVDPTQILQDMRGAARARLAENPALDDLLTKQSTVSAMNEIMPKAAARHEGPRLFGMEVNIRQPGEQVTSRAGRVFSGVGKGLRKIGETGENITGSPLGQYILPKLGGIAFGASQNAPQPTNLLGVQQQLQSQGQPDLSGQMGGMTSPLGYPQQRQGLDQRQIFLGLVSQGMKPETAITISKFLGTSGGGGKPLPAGALKDFADVKQGLSLLDSMEGSLDTSSFDPIMGTLRELNPLKGYDTTYEKNDAMIRQVRQIIGKGLEGGVLRKEDEEKYRHMLPTQQDTPIGVANKINLLKETLLNKYNTLAGTYQQGGYNPFVGGGGDFSSPELQQQYYME